jgi:hypothetical protein
VVLVVDIKAGSPFLVYKRIACHYYFWVFFCVGRSVWDFTMSNVHYQFARCNGKLGVSYKSNRFAFIDIDEIDDLGTVSAGEQYFIPFDYLWSRPQGSKFIAKASDIEILEPTASKGPLPSNEKLIPALFGDKFGIAVTTQRDIAMCLLKYPKLDVSK